MSFDSYVNTVNHETAKYRFEIHIAKTLEGRWRAYIVGVEKSAGTREKIGTIDGDQDVPLEKFVAIIKSELDKFK